MIIFRVYCSMEPSYSAQLTMNRENEKKNDKEALKGKKFRSGDSSQHLILFISQLSDAHQCHLNIYYAFFIHI